MMILETHQARTKKRPRHRTSELETEVLTFGVWLDCLAWGGKYYWLVKLDHFPQAGVRIESLSNHHLEIFQTFSINQGYQNVTALQATFKGSTEPSHSRVAPSSHHLPKEIQWRVCQSTEQLMQNVGHFFLHKIGQKKTLGTHVCLGLVSCVHEGLNATCCKPPWSSSWFTCKEIQGCRLCPATTQRTFHLRKWGSNDLGFVDGPKFFDNHFWTYTILDNNSQGPFNVVCLLAQYLGESIFCLKKKFHSREGWWFPYTK